MALTAVDRINAVLSENYESGAAKDAALRAARASEFSGFARQRDISLGRFDLSILKGRIVNGDVEIYARVYRNGEQLGFGPDGSVDVERFVVCNPPLLVPDDTGDIVKIIRGREARYRVDLKETLARTFADMVRQSGKTGTKIMPGKEGRTTYTIYSGTGDGWLYSSNATYATARSGSGLGADTADTVIYTGQANFSSYQCDEAFISFDTSGVVGNVTSATLSLVNYSYQMPATNFTVRARRLDWATLTTADWIAGASVSGQTLLASLSTASFVPEDYAALTSEAAFLTNINQSGTTGIILTSSLFEAGTSPSGDDQIGIYAANESGTTKDPKLVVVAAASSIPVFMHHLRQQGMA